MENFNFNVVNDRQPETAVVSKTFLSSVFSWMAAALAITGIVAYQFGTDADYLRMLVNVTGGLSGLGYVVMFAPLAFVLVINFGLERLSYVAILTLFLIYSVVMGMSLSFIFLLYTQASIYSTFGIAAGMFGMMALVGYTTKTDLSNLRSFFMMAVVGIIVASVVNIFMQSDGLSYAISFIGVIVFTGLTAYKVQMLKDIGAQVEEGTESANKLAIWGAMSLYITFVNLFLSLLRLFGGRRN